MLLVDSYYLNCIESYSHNNRVQFNMVQIYMKKLWIAHDDAEKKGNLEDPRLKFLQLMIGYFKLDEMPDSFVSFVFDKASFDSETQRLSPEERGVLRTRAHQFYRRKQDKAQVTMAAADAGGSGATAPLPPTTHAPTKLTHGEARAIMAAAGGSAVHKREQYKHALERLAYHRKIIADIFVHHSCTCGGGECSYQRSCPMGQHHMNLTIGAACRADGTFKSDSAQKYNNSVKRVQHYTQVVSELYN